MVQVKRKYKLPVGRWLLLLAIPLAWATASYEGWLDYFENRTIDWRFQDRGEIPAPIKVVYVDVDSHSIDVIGNFPWSRHYFATVAEKLISVAGVRAVGFDFVISPNGVAESADEKYLVAGDRQFAQYLIKMPPAVAPPVVLAASYVATEFISAANIPSQRGLALVTEDTRKEADIHAPEVTEFQVNEQGLRLKPPYVGLIDTIKGGARTVPIWAPTNEGNFYHMALELARLYWGLPVNSYKLHDDRLEMVRPDGSIQATVPLRNRQLVDVNWFSPWDSVHNPRQSFDRVYIYADMLTSEVEDERKTAQEFFANPEFKDAVVLIGPVDPLLQDIATTPVDETPKPRVGIHGNLLKTIVSGLYLRPASVPVVWGTIIGLTLIVSLFAAAGGSGGLRSKLTAALLLTFYVVACFHLFSNYQIVLPLAAPIGSVLTTSLTAIIWQLMEEERQKGRIKGMFGAYVSPQLVNTMVDSGEDPQLGGHESEITAYFSDIQSFSSFSEVLPPAKLVELMNEYLTACTDIVQEKGGTLDKYIGDAVVAMFGAPVTLKDHAFRACVATQLVHQRLAELRTKWKAEGDKWPEIVGKMQSRIGLNSGLATIGNMGSRTRFNYTMMGDNVNLAARMESGAKSWGVYTMVTEATRTACRSIDPGKVIFRALGKIVVMGRSQPVPIYEIVGLKENVSASALECISLFERGLGHYHALEWDAAIQLFKRSAELEPNQPRKTPGVKLNPSLVYLNITEDYRAQPPPADWNGAYVMKEK